MNPSEPIMIGMLKMALESLNEATERVKKFIMATGMAEDGVDPSGEEVWRTLEMMAAGMDQGVFAVCVPPAPACEDHQYSMPKCGACDALGRAQEAADDAAAEVRVEQVAASLRAAGFHVFTNPEEFMQHLASDLREEAGDADGGEGSSEAD